MLTLYGLKTCDTCRKALRALEASGQPVTFRDVRSQPLDRAEVSRFLGVFGAALMNTRSTTWRSLSDAERKRPVEDLLTDFPALMKRPLIERNGDVTLGWDREVQARYLG